MDYLDLDRGKMEYLSRAREAAQRAWANGSESDYRFAQLYSQIAIAESLAEIAESLNTSNEMLHRVNQNLFSIAGKK